MNTCTECGSARPPSSGFCPHCGARAVAADAAEPAPGSVLEDRYRIVARLGEGAASVVLLARHERLDRDVAVKILRPSYLALPGALDRFAREAQVAARIAHDNVVQVFDFGLAAAGFHFLVMEYVPGVSLERAIAEKGGLAVPRAIHVLAQVAAGLGAAHALGLVHRDLKPANVMLAQRGPDHDFVKLVDFGLARPIQTTAQSPKLTRAGELQGTPAYMAPECWYGSVADARADIYAFGIMAFEILTGGLPFEADTMLAMMHRQMTEPPPLPSRRRPLGAASAAIDALVGACLRKDAAERPATIRHVLDALSQQAVSQAESGR